jgi:flavin-dependent dehydrogenase
MWDVIVVGAGPGGSVAAKICAEEGLKTLLLERRELPRDKVCSGILAGETAKNLIREKFGDFPNGVLAHPYYLRGQIVYVQGAEPGIIKQSMPIAWRRDLDYWMTRKAQERGTEVLESTRLLGISEHKGSYTVLVQKKGIREEISTKFVIGADGATSVLRKLLFPVLKVSYNQEIRECYEGDFPLDKEYIHTFYDPVRKYWFVINHKGPFFLLEVSGRLGETKKLKEMVVKPLLAKNYGFNVINRDPLWIDATVEAKLYEQLISGEFSPAKDNVLLVGDAAGFQLPTGEGIGTALKSGLLAGGAIVKAIRESKKAADIYLAEIKGIMELIKILHPLAIKSKFTAEEHPQVIVAGIIEMMEKSLKPIV